MPKFPNALQAWQSPAFVRALKDELESMDPLALPLDQGTSHGGFVKDAAITATVLKSMDDGSRILAEVGVFFSEILGGCSCGDEPEEINSYCRLQIRIDKASAEAEVCVVLD